MQKKIRNYGTTILLVAALLMLATPAVAQPSTPFVINGWVLYENDTACNNSAVNITNPDTGAEWQADTNASYNYYRIMLANGTDLNVSEMLQFSVTSPGMDQSNVTEHTVTQAEVDAGGFECNITLTPPANIVINEFVSHNTTEWVELYNNGTTSVNLSGWTLEDGASHVKPLSGTIPAEGYLVFGPYTGWLNDGGDIIYLNNTAANIDKVAYGNWDDGNTADNALKPDAGESTGRYPNGVDTNNDAADFQVFDNPTSGAPNIIDTTPPWWSAPETDPVTIYEGTEVTFYTNWNDNVALSGYIFSTNQSGEWDNESFTEFSATPEDAEPVMTITASAGTTVGWRFYANDTSDNWNVSDIQTFVVSAGQDTTAPVINTVILNTTTPNTGDAILVTVDATDDVGVTNVTANGIGLTHQGDNIWNGTITAIVGTHSVNVSAVDAAGNTGWNNSTSYTAITDITPPASVTDLANTTYEQTSINWTWSDPEDTDFSHVMVYIDGISQPNVTKGTQFYNATALTHNTTYEISTHTVDESGNVNATWVNHTARTNTSPYITPVSVEIGDYDMLPSPSGNLTAPIMLQGIKDYGAATIILEYNESVVHVTDVADGPFSTVAAYNISNTTGTVNISAQNTAGVDGDIEFARITFEAVGVDGDTTQLNLSVQLLWDIDYNSLANHTSNGSITLINRTPPVISNENATPGKIIQTILSGRDRNVGRNSTTLSVNVTDTGGSGVKNVTINLTSIGGSANTSMTNGGSGDIYSVDTTATDGINLTHNLVVTARDNNDNNATSNITLEVLRRGDVVRNNNVTMGDALYIARYTVGLEPPADNWLLVGDVVGEGGNELGDNSVDMGDALFISRRTVGLEDEP